MKFPIFSHGCRVTTWNYKRLNWGCFWWKYDLGRGVVTCNFKSEETLENLFFWNVWTRLASWIELGFSFLVPHFCNSGTIKFPCQKHEVFGRNMIRCVSSSPVPGLSLPGQRRSSVPGQPHRSTRHPKGPAEHHWLTLEPREGCNLSLEPVPWQLPWLRGWFCMAQLCIILSPLNLTLKQRQDSAAAAAWEGRHGEEQVQALGSAFVWLKQHVAGVYIISWELQLREGLEWPCTQYWKHKSVCFPAGLFLLHPKRLYFNPLLLLETDGEDVERQEGKG